MNATSPNGRKSGAARVREVFRQVPQRQISRTVVRTLAQQRDYMKRVRYNSGERMSLQGEGIIILGDYTAHTNVARKLGVPVPEDSCFVSVRVASRKPHHGEDSYVSIEGTSWVVAGDFDPPEPAPQLPDLKNQVAD